MTRLQRLRAERRAAGVCRNCGREPVKRYRNCRRCRERLTVFKQAVRDANRAAQAAKAAA